MPNQRLPEGGVNQKPGGWKLVVVAVVVLGVIMAGVVIAQFFWQNANQPIPTPAIEPILDGNFTLSGGSYKYFNFTIPSGPTTSWVDGTFTVIDGNEGVRVYVMDSGNFTNWQNGHVATMYYNSGLADAGNVTATIPPNGTYYLVYDNIYSAVSITVISRVDLLTI